MEELKSECVDMVAEAAEGGVPPVQTLVLGDSVFVGGLTELGMPALPASSGPSASSRPPGSGKGQLAAQAFGGGDLPGLQALASQHSPGARALLEQILAMSCQINDQASGTVDEGVSSIVP